MWLNLFKVGEPPEKGGKFRMSTGSLHGRRGAGAAPAGARGFLHRAPDPGLATLFSRAAWECFASLLDDEVLHDATNAVGWGYARCYAPHCEARAGGQALVPGAVAAHCGQLGGLVHRRRPRLRRQRPAPTARE